MTPATIRPRFDLLDALQPPERFHATVTLRTLPALIDQNNQLAGIAAEQVRATEQLGRAVETGMSRLTDAQVAAAGFVAASVERLRAEVRAVTGTLDDIRQEVEQARRVQEQQLAVQQEGLDLQRRSLALQQGMLQSDHLQAKLEEFIYQFKKAVERYGVDDPENPAPTRLLMLRGFLGEVAQQGIATPMIRGIDKKGLFDDTVAKAERLVRELTAHPDVLAAVEMARREQQRAEEEEKERERRLSALKAREADLRQQAKAIQKEIGQKESALVTSYDLWFKKRFGFQFHSLIAVSLVLSILSCCGAPVAFGVIDGGTAKKHDANATAENEKAKDAEQYSVGSVVAGLMWCCGVPGVWVLLGASYLVFSSLHKSDVGDAAKHQEELDRTVNAETLAEIARLKEKLAPVKDALEEIRKESGRSGADSGPSPEPPDA